jgi:hypothetical protein
MPASAEDVLVRLNLGNGKVRAEQISLERVSPSHFRFTYPKNRIADDVVSIDVIPDFMTARKGDEGYWIDARGAYGRFEKDEGCYANDRAGWMPIFALKRGDALWYGQVSGWRCDYRFNAVAKGGRYEAFPRFMVKNLREYYPVYQDIVVDFRRLDGRDADYIGYAKAYRKHQFENAGIKMARDRAKTNPVTDYLLESFVVRISQHCRKQVLKDRTMRLTRANEQPLLVHMPFLICEDFVQQLHDAGVDKTTILSAGWTSGGYDGRYPDMFPVEPAIGGERGFKAFAEKCRALGFQISAEVDYTEMYGPADRFNLDFACRYANGQFPDGGFWPGGLAYNLCTKKALDMGWCQTDFARLHDVIGFGPLFFDVMSAIEPRRCGHPVHMMTSDDMGGVYSRLYALAQTTMGGAASECGFDIGIRHLDYINYLWHEIGFLKSNKFNGFQSGVFPVWELVYHGVVFYTSDRWLQNHTYGNEDRSNGAFDFGWGIYDRKEDPEKALKIVEFGSRPILYSHSFSDIPSIVKAWREYRPVRHLQKEEMTGHRELAPDVFETAYGDGSRTVVNYRKTPFAEGSLRIPALGYVLVLDGGAVRTFAFDEAKGLSECIGHVGF